MKWLINNWKLVGTVSLIVAAIAGYLLAKHFYDLFQAEKQKSSLIAASKSNFQVIPITRFTDTAGHKHAVIAADQNKFNQSTINQNPTISLGGADTAALALKIQRDQIQYWMSVATKSEARALKAETRLDSAGKLVHYYESKFIKLAFHPGKDSTDNGTFDYTKYEQLNALQYWKRLHIIGPRTSFIDISSNDPNTVITGIKTFAVQPDPNPFTLRGQIKSTFDFANSRLTPAAGLVGTYKNWEFSYHYYYSTQFQKLEPIISGAYNFWLR